MRLSCHLISWAAALLAAPARATLPSPLICEDTINGAAPYNQNDVPCLLGCGLGVTQATGSLLPGSINTTDTPYCEARCVREQDGGTISPAQLSAAPACHSACQYQYRVGGTPEQFGWCMYWCVDGVTLVESTTCVPWQAYGTPYTTVTAGGSAETLRGELSQGRC